MAKATKHLFLSLFPYLPLCVLILMVNICMKALFGRSIIKRNAKFRCKHLKSLKTVKNTGNIVFLFHDLFPWFIHPAKTISILSWYFLSSKTEAKANLWIKYNQNFLTVHINIILCSNFNIYG